VNKKAFAFLTQQEGRLGQKMKVSENAPLIFRPNLLASTKRGQAGENEKVAIGILKKSDTLPISMSYGMTATRKHKN
jgi:hypothetical protein